MTLEPLQYLMNVDAIKSLKARYFRCLDTKDWDGWLDVFTDDVVLSFDTAVSTDGKDGKTVTYTGKKMVAEIVPRDLVTAQTVHQGHMPEIDFISDAEARVIWAMEDIVDYGNNNVVGGQGHYREVYRKSDGRWRIASVHLTRIRLFQTCKDQLRL